jgi:tetratricopeptide (TPR) repeat protein
MIGLVQVGAQAMADRYAYIPFWGLQIALVWTVWEALRARPESDVLRRTVGVGFLAVCTALAILSFRQAEHWHDSIALFEDAVASTQRNYIAERALAAQYFNRGDYTRALQHAEEGASYPRDLGEILPIYGMALYQTGSKQAAIEQLVRATQVAPTKPMGFTNLGWVYLQEGRYELAVEALSAALGVDPSSARAAQLLTGPRSNGPCARPTRRGSAATSTRFWTCLRPMRAS